ncbi:MAG: GNAT family N-acetyltransferase [OCS116 cluster bacterium]|nr:GNAT family N-acetyltransferase [OCS116 cluster bacterium]
MRFELNRTFDNWLSLHKLLTDCFAYMDQMIDPPSSLRRMTADGLREKAAKENLLVVYDADQLIGCAYFDIRPDVIYVGKVAIAQSHRGRGIAYRVFAIADNLARDNDKKWLELETRIELIDNHQAFGKMGFVTTAKNSHAGYDHPTSITMRRTVMQ